MTKSKTSKPDTLEATRDALPFFRKGNRTVKASWWNVTPSGDYAADLATGHAYAKDFLPMLSFNGGAAALGWIVSDMAIAGRSIAGSSREWHGVDAVAAGFMLGIGGSLQSAIGVIAVAAVAIEMPKGDLGAKVVNLVKSGHALDPLRRSTLYHNPSDRIISVRR
jgi:hypothetical protein